MGLRRKNPGGELTRAQLEQLVYGHLLCGDDDDVFESEDLERAAWAAHRGELLLAQPGRRPAAFFKFDLGIAVPRDIEQLGVLLDRGVIDANEAAAIEAANPNLRADQSLAADPLWDDRDKLYQYVCNFPPQPGPRTFYAVQGYRHEFDALAAGMDTAARWHDWRQRPALAELYRKRAEIARGLYTEAVAAVEAHPDRVVWRRAREVQDDAR